MLDLTAGLGFLSKLSNIPAEYKDKIDAIYLQSNNGSLTHEDINKTIDYFRTESIRHIHSDTDRAHFASAFMMTLHALDDYKLLKEEDWKRKEKALKRAKAQ